MKTTYKYIKKSESFRDWMLFIQNLEYYRAEEEMAEDILS